MLGVEILRVEQLLLLCYYSPFSLRCVLWLPANGIPGNRAEEILFVGALEERSAAEMAALLGRPGPLVRYGGGGGRLDVLTLVCLHMS